MEEPKKLTPTDWAVYREIEKATEEGRTIGQKELCEKTGVPYCEHPKSRDHSVPLWFIIERINASYETSKIIVTIRGEYSYKLASEEEANKKYDNLYKQGIKFLLRARALKLKITQDGQGKTVSNQNRAIDWEHEGGAEKFHEAFVDE